MKTVQCALPATTMAVWQIMSSAYNVPLQHCSSRAQVHVLQQAIDVITRRTHCYHDCVYVMPLLLL